MCAAPRLRFSRRRLRRAPCTASVRAPARPTPLRTAHAPRLATPRVPSRRNSVLRDVLSDLSDTQAAVSSHRTLEPPTHPLPAERFGVQVLPGRNRAPRRRGRSPEPVPYGTASRSGRATVAHIQRISGRSSARWDSSASLLRVRQSCSLCSSRVHLFCSRVRRCWPRIPRPLSRDGRDQPCLWLHCAVLRCAQ